MAWFDSSKFQVKRCFWELYDSLMLESSAWSCLFSRINESMLISELFFGFEDLLELSLLLVDWLLLSFLNLSSLLSLDIVLVHIIL